MKTFPLFSRSLVLSGLLALLGTALGPQNSAATVRLSYNAYFPQDSDHGGTEFGPSAGLGLFWLEDLLFTELEIGYVSSDRAETLTMNGGTVEAEGRQRMIPLLAHLQLAFPLGDSGGRIYGGLTAGAAYVDGDITVRSGGESFSADASDLVFAYGGGGGLLFPLAQPLHLDIQYRYLKFSEATFRPGDLPTEFSVDIPDMHRVTAGLMLKF